MNLVNICENYNRIKCWCAFYIYPLYSCPCAYLNKCQKFRHDFYYFNLLYHAALLKYRTFDVIRNYILICAYFFSFSHLLIKLDTLQTRGNIKHYKPHASALLLILVFVISHYLIVGN